MGDMLQTGVSWLQQKLKAKCSRQVEYRRGELKATVSVTLGKKLLKLGNDVGGVEMIWTDRDYLVAAADLKVVFGEPARGDVIADTEDGTVNLYEVNAPGGEPAWIWGDPYRVLLRIHAKFIGPETS